jgi:hypothetical protein
VIGRDVSDLMLKAYRGEHLLSHLYGHDASGEMPEVPMAGRRSEAGNLVTQASVQAGCRTDCLFVANMSRQCAVGSMCDDRASAARCDYPITAT